MRAAKAIAVAIRYAHEMQNKENQESEALELRAFLEAGALYEDTKVSVRVYYHRAATPPKAEVFRLHLPVIRLHCTSRTCQGPRFFEPRYGDASESNLWELDETFPFHSDTDIALGGRAFIDYHCKNCGLGKKTYALEINMDFTHAQDQEPGHTPLRPASAMKLGEFPPHVPHTPRDLLGLLGEQRDLYLKGRRAENYGLGIGAFTYYRRVVEDQKAQLLARIREVAEREGAPSETLSRITQAAEAREFTRSVELMSEAMPDSLRIDGHNPLQLLHTALSVGVHELTDNDCHERAGTVRAVLIGFAKRVASALHDDAELRAAVSKLTAIDTKLARESDNSSEPNVQ
jgi:hypothetical protein